MNEEERQGSLSNVPSFSGPEGYAPSTTYEPQKGGSTSYAPNPTYAPVTLEVRSEGGTLETKTSTPVMAKGFTPGTFAPTTPKPSIPTTFTIPAPKKVGGEVKMRVDPDVVELGKAAKEAGVELVRDEAGKVVNVTLPEGFLSEDEHKEKIEEIQGAHAQKVGQLEQENAMKEGDLRVLKDLIPITVEFSMLHTKATMSAENNPTASAAILHQGEAIQALIDAIKEKPEYTKFDELKSKLETYKATVASANDQKEEKIEAKPYITPAPSGTAIGDKLAAAASENGGIKVRPADQPAPPEKASVSLVQAPKDAPKETVAVPVTIAPASDPVLLGPQAAAPKVEGAEVASHSEQAPSLEEERKKNILRFNLTKGGRLKEVSNIRQPKLKEFGEAPELKVGQKITLQDKNTFAIGKWEITSIEGEEATVENLDNKGEKRTMGVQELAAILQTNRYYKEKWQEEHASSQTPPQPTQAQPEPETKGEIPASPAQPDENKTERGAFIPPLKEFFTAFNTRTTPPFNPKALSSWKRRWVDSGKIDTFREQEGNIKVTDAQVKDMKEALDVCTELLLLNEETPVNRELAYQAQQDIVIAARILSGYHDEKSNDIKYYIDKNIQNGPWLDQVRNEIARVQKIKEGNAVITPPVQAPPAEQRADEALQTEITSEPQVIVPAHIKQMMAQVHAQAQEAEQATLHEEPQGRSEDNTIEWEAPAEFPARNQEVSPVVPDPVMRVERSLRRAAETLTSRESWLSKKFSSLQLNNVRALAIALAVAIPAAGASFYALSKKKEEQVAHKDSPVTQAVWNGAPAVPSLDKGQAFLDDHEHATWFSYMNTAKETPRFRDWDKDIKRLSEADLLKKVTPLFSANSNNINEALQKWELIKIYKDKDEFGKEVINAYNLQENERKELSDLISLLDETSMVTSASHIESKTLGAAILEARAKVLAKEKMQGQVDKMI